MNLILDYLVVVPAFLPVYYLWLHINFLWLTLSFSLDLNIVMNQIILIHAVLSFHLVVDFPPLHWWESTVSTELNYFEPQAKLKLERPAILVKLKSKTNFISLRIWASTQKWNIVRCTLKNHLMIQITKL